MNGSFVAKRPCKAALERVMILLYVDRVGWQMLGAPIGFTKVPSTIPTPLFLILEKLEN